MFLISPCKSKGYGADFPFVPFPTDRYSSFWVVDHPSNRFISNELINKEEIMGFIGPFTNRQDAEMYIRMND